MFALVNKFGLFIMSMGNTRGDVCFTKLEQHALKFSSWEEAEMKKRRHPLMKLDVIQLQNDYKKKGF